MNEEEALRLCQRGDREAFRHLVERYQHVLYGTACLMTGDTTAAQDLVQEAFLSAWRGMGSFQTGRPVKPWLVRILVNKVLSYRRGQSPPAASLREELARSPDASEIVEAVENQEQVRQALGGLSEEHRQVVMLRYFTGLSLAKISAALGCREGTVKSRLHRALEQLRDLLQGA